MCSIWVKKDPTMRTLPYDDQNGSLDNQFGRMNFSYPLSTVHGVGPVLLLLFSLYTLERLHDVERAFRVYV